MPYNLRQLPPRSEEKWAPGMDGLPPAARGTRRMPAVFMARFSVKEPRDFARKQRKIRRVRCQPRTSRKESGRYVGARAAVGIKLRQDRVEREDDRREVAVSLEQDERQLATAFGAPQSIR